jgi:uncharacterized protein YacL
MICPKCKNPIEKDTPECEWCGEVIFPKKTNKEYFLQKVPGALIIFFLIGSIIGTIFFFLLTVVEEYNGCIIGIIICVILTVWLSISLIKKHQNLKNNKL